MPAPKLRIKNRVAYFRKAVRTPDFTSQRVLTTDAFRFGELWLKRHCGEALPYWRQARAYYVASQNLPSPSSPLTIYYCFLNATKSLLLVKKKEFKDQHGVGGNFEASKRALQNEKVNISQGGVIGALANNLQDERPEDCTLSGILLNLPFVHRAYRYTYKSHPELFIPLRNVVYRKPANQNEVWLSADVEGRFVDGRSMRTLPDGFEVDQGYSGDSRLVIRSTKRIGWFHRGDNESDRGRAYTRLQNLHATLRKKLVFISSSPDLWYLKRKVSNSVQLNRCGMTLMFAAMHRLSGLSRYDPKGLMAYLDGKENWLLTEFIDLAPDQFIDEIVCEMTSLEFSRPGIRPRQT